MRGLLPLCLAAFATLCLHAQPAGPTPYVSGAEDIALGEIILGDLAPVADRESSSELMIRAARQMLGQP